MTWLSPFERRVEETIRKRRLLRQGERVIVAVSGGPDSTAMLAVLHRLREAWGLGLCAVHLNYGLRGNDSDDDAECVRSLGAAMDVEVIVRSVPLSRVDAQKAGRSLQDHARVLRYAVLAEVAAARRAEKIAVGQTVDDQAETILMRMMRGAGTGGLSGIPPMRDRVIVRPLLDVTRQEVLSYLRERGLAYRVDATNQELLYLRNRIRHEVLPIVTRYNPNVVRGLARQADVLREEDAYLDELAMDAWRRIEKTRGDGVVVLDRSAFLACSLTIRRRILRLVIRQLAHLPYKPGFELVERVLAQIVERPSGSTMAVSGIRIRRQYDEVWFEEDREGRCAAPSHEPVHQVPIPSRIAWPGTGQILAVSEGTLASHRLASNARQVCFDRSTFSEPLIVRAWRPGDYFCPSGMLGRRKKLQDFFSDAKVPKSKRHRIPLLVAPEGILWVGGYRTDHRFRVTDSTREVVVAALTEEASDREWNVSSAGR